MADRTRGYAHRIDVRAPPEELWRGLIEPEQIAQWYAPGARISARQGGSFWIRADKDLEREAHLDVFLPPRRLRLLYMPQRGMPPTDSVLVDDFVVDSQPDGSVLRLLGSGYPDGAAWESFYLRMRDGWARALQRLKLVTERRCAAQTEASS
jgi:uncharacterized protein YndB with AHSA1/START domain